MLLFESCLSHGLLVEISWNITYPIIPYRYPTGTLQVPYRYPTGILQVPSPIPGHPQYLSYLLAPPGTLLAALRGWRSEPHHTADLPPWDRPNGISKWTGFGSYVVGRRLIERRQLLCVFLSRLLFSRVLALSMGWGGVGYSRHVQVTSNALLALRAALLQVTSNTLLMLRFALLQVTSNTLLTLRAALLQVTSLDVTLCTSSSNFKHALDVTLCTSSSNFKHALDVTPCTYSSNFKHALDVALCTSSSNFSHALDVTLCSSSSNF